MDALMEKLNVKKDDVFDVIVLLTEDDRANATRK